MSRWSFASRVAGTKTLPLSHAIEEGPFRSKIADSFAQGVANDGVLEEPAGSKAAGAVTGDAATRSTGRIRAAFAEANGPAFIGFVTGGDPSLAQSEEYILAMVEAGADLIEIGIPFSDPIAEGPVIQEADLRALAAGTTVNSLFALVRSLRTKTDVPLVFLTYLNPVYHFGYAAFFAACREAGVDGVIIPDLPYDEKGEVAPIAAQNGVDLISLIAPTSATRIQTIAREATGFIYLVSSLGVTGVRGEIRTDLASIIAEIRTVSNLPVAVGFGIHTPEQAHRIAQLADGVIVGSALVKLIAANPNDAAASLHAYISEMKAAMRAD
jgi:tryptophan synthase alpha chain